VNASVFVFGESEVVTLIHQRSKADIRGGPSTTPCRLESLPMVHEEFKVINLIFVLIGGLAKGRWLGQFSSEKFRSKPVHPGRTGFASALGAALHPLPAEHIETEYSLPKVELGDGIRKAIKKNIFMA